MIPDVSIVLQGTAGKLLGEVAPALPQSYLQGTTGTIGVALMLIAQSHGKAAELLAWENARMRALLGDAEESEASLALDALSAGNRRLKARLVDVHAHASCHDAALAKTILDFLNESADKRLLHLPLF